MKIGIDLTFVRPDHKNGGTEAALKNLIKGIEQIRYQDSYRDMEFVYFIHRDIYEDYKVIFPNLKYHVYDMKGKHPVRMILFQTFVLPKLAKEELLDLLYFPTFQSGLRKKWPVKLIINPNDIQYCYYPEYFSFFKRIYYHIFYKNSLQKAECLIAISQYVKDCYLEHFAKDIFRKMKVIYVPIDFDDISEEVVEQLVGNEKKYILCINSLTKHKNLITLIRAFHKLGDSNLKLVIGGAAWNGANELQDYIEQNGLQDSVILTGRVSDGQLQYMYRNAKLFVTPSLYEGFGMTPIEAMVAECPVVSSKETSLYEVTKGMVTYYAPATDAEQLKDVMQKTLQRIDAGEYTKDYLQGLHEEVKRSYNKEIIAKQFLDTFLYGTNIPSENTQNVYARIFDYAKEQMDKQNNPSLRIQKQEFLASLGTEPKVVDITPLQRYDQESFANSLYLSLFQRMPSEEFQKTAAMLTNEQILKHAVKESSFATRGLKIKGYYYRKYKPGIKGKILAIASVVKNSVFLRKMAKKMPKGIQDKIRGMFA